jgi:hypothetical protein
MSRALLEQFVAVSGLELKPEFFRRCQREFRDHLLPLYDEVESLRAENETLKAHAEKVSTRRPKAEAAA